MMISAEIIALEKGRSKGLFHDQIRSQAGMHTSAGAFV